MVHFYGRYTFLSGVILGILLAVSIKKIARQWETKNPEIFNKKYHKWFEKQGIKRHPSWITKASLPRSLHKKYLLESQFLFNKIKITCFIFTKKDSNLNLSLTTWARGCNTVKPLVIQKAMNAIPDVKRDKKNSSWSILCKALKSVKLDQLDWVFIANQYTFAIMDNFRYYVAGLDFQKPHYLGHAVEFWGTAYNSKTSAYALNKRAIDMFKKLVDNKNCFAEKAYLNKEDFYLGRMLATLNITPTDTRDDLGFSLFYPNTWEQVMFPFDFEGIFQVSIYPVSCCSRMSIAFQTNNNNKMFTFYYLLYKTQVFRNQHLKKEEIIFYQNQSDNEPVWKKFLASQNISAEGVSKEQYYKIWENIVSDPSSPWFKKVEDYSLDFDVD